jgi:Tropinone reductase 1
MWNLSNKFALVTGGTKGIGKATVLEFLDLGAEVLFTSRTQKDIDALLKELKAYGKKAHGLVADVAIAQDRQKVYAYIEKHWNKLDILVNNAGINIRKKAKDYSDEEFRKVMEINLNAPFEFSRKLHFLLKKDKHSTIVNVASSAAMQDVGTGTPYAMSKAGLLQQTRSLAVEWAGDGIRVNAVSPWFTVTPLTKGLLEEEHRMNPIIQRTPLKRVAKASEIAAIIAFLAMDKSSYITGQNIIADGGMSINAI